jgi:hypothetical protein
MIWYDIVCSMYSSRYLLYITYSIVEYGKYKKAVDAYTYARCQKLQCKGVLDYIAYSGEYTGAFSFSSEN